MSHLPPVTAAENVWREREVEDVAVVTEGITSQAFLPILVHVLPAFLHIVVVVILIVIVVWVRARMSHGCCCCYYCLRFAPSLVHFHHRRCLLHGSVLLAEQTTPASMMTTIRHQSSPLEWEIVPCWVAMAALLPLSFWCQQWGYGHYRWPPRWLGQQNWSQTPCCVHRNELSDKCRVDVTSLRVVAIHQYIPTLNG